MVGQEIDKIRKTGKISLVSYWGRRYANMPKLSPLPPHVFPRDLLESAKEGIKYEEAALAAAQSFAQNPTRGNALKGLEFQDLFVELLAREALKQAREQTLKEGIAIGHHIFAGDEMEMVYTICAISERSVACWP